MCSVNNAKNARRFTDLHEFLPWLKDSRVRYNTIYDRDHLLPRRLRGYDRFDMRTERRDNVSMRGGEIDGQYGHRWMGRFVGEVLHRTGDSSVRCVDWKDDQGVIPRSRP